MHYLKSVLYALLSFVHIETILLQLFVYTELLCTVHLLYYYVLQRVYHANDAKNIKTA